MRRLFVLLPLAAGLTACGGASESGALQVGFTVSRGGPALPCAQVSEVLEVDVLLKDATGAVVGGVPRSAECADGVWSVSGVEAGEYTVQISAKGALSGDTSAVLFRASEVVTAPGSFDVVLQPQVAYLALDWTFGEAELGPCGTEVDTIDVIVSTGAGQEGSFSETFACTDGPVSIPQPLDLQQYLISVTANSSEGFPLFTHAAQRLLDRGLNTYTANLMPLGGQVFVDWDFVVQSGDMPVRPCDADSVQVLEALVTIESLEGGAPISEMVDCTDRPHAFAAARFTQGRQLALRVEAVGAERFIAEETFTMPAGDRVGERLVLHATSTATIAVEVSTSSCTPAQDDGIDMTITLQDDTRQLDVTVPAGERSVVLPELWFGTYLLEASVRTPQGPLCARTEYRVVDDGHADWGTLRF